MTRRLKILILIAAVAAAVLVFGYVVAKFTTWGMPYRLGRLHQQIERRYFQLQEMYRPDEVKKFLAAELNQNRLIHQAAFSGEKLKLCYVDNVCEDFYVGIED